MDTLKICEKDRIKVRDLIVIALAGIPIETLQRITEQVMELPGYSRDTTITDQAFQDALKSIVREAAEHWAKENRVAINTAVLKALNGRQDEILEGLTQNITVYLGDLKFSLSISSKR